VSGTRTKRRWGKARGVAAREQKRTGVAACGCGTDALDASGPERAMACRTRASAAGARPGRSGPGTRVRQQACAAAAQERFLGGAERMAQACAWWRVGVGGVCR
jgi:hypothetical protein